MKGWCYDAVGAAPSWGELPDPACPPDGVVVRVGATGICRSDWHAWRGHDPVPLPMIPGHEFAGTVVQVGPLVTGLSVGARVTAPFVLGCGRCELCRSGQGQVCPDQDQPGFTIPGSFAELLALPRADFNVVPLPEQVDLVAGAALGCRFATAYRALVTHARVAPGQWVAVYGCGGLGLSAVQIAVALGARVVAVDPVPTAAARAADLGAEAVSTPSPTGDPVAEILDITGGGADVGLDAVGSAVVAGWSLAGLRRRGRHVQAGLVFAPAAVALATVISRELEIYGSHGMPARDYPGLLELVAAGTLAPQQLIGRRIRLDEAGAVMTTSAEARESADGLVIAVA